MNIGADYEGYYLDGAGKMVPTRMLADMAKGIRTYSTAKMGPGKAAVKAFGFTPMRVADQGKASADRAAENAK